jgi:hypothetical protein
VKKSLEEAVPEPWNAPEGAKAVSAIGVESDGDWLPPTDKAAPGKVQRPESAVLADISEDAVRTALLLISGGADTVAGARIGASLTMQDKEINSTAPALTRIINRNPRAKAMFNMGHAGDALQLAMGGGMYAWRVAGEAAETQRVRKAVEEANADAVEVVE